MGFGRVGTSGGRRRRGRRRLSGRPRPTGHRTDRRREGAQPGRAGRPGGGRPDPSHRGAATARRRPAGRHDPGRPPASRARRRVTGPLAARARPADPDRRRHGRTAPRGRPAAARVQPPLGDLHPDPPEPASRKYAPDAIDEAGAGQAAEAIRVAEAVLDTCAVEPPAVLRGGGVGVRELRRIARTVGVTDEIAGMLLERDVSRRWPAGRHLGRGPAVAANR
ncbi:hypothetical protein [Fodinicola feengrottensis]|uniref:hypothetical protein n=1 Tax=Fodinicola feengrottensis TaxID=435914 RepID=UPI002440FE1C|nr:hypothetical protein [Fodinicola feengrottensis]